MYNYAVNSDDKEEFDLNITIRLASPDDALDMAVVGMRSWEAAYKNILSADYIREKMLPAWNNTNEL